jgi:hypothetical protein
MPARHPIATANGWFNVVTGLWPVLHIRSFEAVTGPKADRWLVKSVGLLLAAIGLTQIQAHSERDAATLGVGTACSTLAIDVFYVLRKRISRVYLIDAAMEAAWIGAWVRSGAFSRRHEDGG